MEAVRGLGGPRRGRSAPRAARTVGAAVLAGVLAVAGGALAAATAAAATATVAVGPEGNELAFTPRTVTVRPGDSVSWVWGQRFPHSVTSDGASGEAFDSDIRTAPFTYTRPFASRGWFPYFCRVHRGSGMTGSVLVAASTPPTASFTAAPAAPELGQPVTFDASASGDADPGDSVVSYRWDLDGDGSFETVSPSPTTSTSYAKSGFVTVRLQVVDRQGDVSEPLARLFFVQGPAPARDATAPRLSAARIRPASFCTRRSEACRSPGARIAFTLSEAASVAGEVTAAGRGRRSAAARALRIQGRAGSNAFRFRGAGLKPGRYRLSLVATDAAGNRSEPASARFAVRR